MLFGRSALLLLPLLVLLLQLQRLLRLRFATSALKKTENLPEKKTREFPPPKPVFSVKMCPLARRYCCYCCASAAIRQGNAQNITHPPKKNARVSPSSKQYLVQNAPLGNLNSRCCSCCCCYCRCCSCCCYYFSFSFLVLLLLLLLLFLRLLLLLLLLCLLLRFKMGGC